VSVGRLTKDGRLLGATKREFIADRDGGWFCHYCGRPLANIDGGETQSCLYTWGRHEHPNGLCFPELDHVVAQARGGSNYVDNLVLACGGRDGCNQVKKALTYLEFVTGWREAA
jgi:5-methylcytosine-specific restriction endonuclease McrA